MSRQAQNTRSLIPEAERPNVVNTVQPERPETDAPQAPTVPPTIEAAQDLPPAAAPMQAIKELFVLDLSATHKSGAREHELLHADGRVRPYIFEPNTPKALPVAIAMRFLSKEGFLHTDKHGEELPWRNPAKRPEELAAGERITIQRDECVARYDELTNDALLLRAAPLPGAERVLQSASDRSVVIKFIIDHYARLAAVNSERDFNPAEEFIPDPIEEY